MVKKYRNLFILTLVALFMSVCSVSAKTLTPEEIGNEALKYVKADEKDAVSYVFVIGRFVYTSTYKNFNIQDIMLAAADSIYLEYGSVDNIKDLVKTMTIYRIDRTYDANLNPTGWKLAENEIGDSEAFASADIHYIDYNEVLNVVNADAVVNQALETIDNDSFDLKLESDGTLSFNIVEGATTLESIEGSGVIDALVKAFDENEGIDSFEIVYDKDAENSYQLYISRYSLDEYTLEELKEFVLNVTGKTYANATLADLVGKYTVIMHLSGDSKFTDSTEYAKTYTVNVKGYVETLIDNHIKSDNYLYDIEREGQDLTVKVLIPETEIKEGMGSGVIAGLLEMVQEEGVTEIDFAYVTGTAENVTLKLTAETTIDDLLTWFDENASKIFAGVETITNADLKDKSFTFKVVTDETDVDSAEEYTVTFE